MSNHDVYRLSGEQRMLASIVAMVFWMLFSTDTMALVTEDNITENFMTDFKGKMAGISANISGLLTYTLFALITIEFVWSMAMMVLHDQGLQGIFKEAIQRIVFIGFWLWLFERGVEIPQMIVDGFYDLGTKSRGVDALLLSPDNVIEIGIDLMIEVAKEASVWKVGQAIAMLIAGSCVFFCFLIVGANMVLLLMEMWLVAFSGVAFLALGPSRWTNSFAVAYLRYLVTVGAKVMIFMIIVGIAYSIIADDIIAVEEKNVGQMWSAAALSFVMMLLSTKAPNSMASAINGAMGSTSTITGTQLLRAGSSAVGSAMGGVGGMLGAGMAAKGAISEGANSAAASYSKASTEGSSAIVSTVKAVGGGVVGATTALGGAAKDDLAGKLSGQQDGNLYPTGGTVGGRMSANMKRKSG